MSYKRVTIITGSAVTDEAIAIMQNKYMPAVRAMGCLEADVIQTGPDSTLLIATYANKAAAKLYKASSPKALIGKNTLDIIHKDFKKVTRERIKEVYERGFTPERENLIVDKEGKTIIVQIAGTLIDYKGNPSVLFTLQNLAGERKAEEELQVSESQYRQLVENINEGIIKFDAKEVITYVNKQFCELVGFPSKELVGNAGRQLLFTTKEAKNISRRVHRSEERRVGKECRSRWSPYH